MVPFTQRIGTMTESQPNFHFLRSTPKDLASSPPLASSLQAFETSLELLTLGRFPAALLSCVNAWESALKAAFEIAQDDRISLFKLLERADAEIPKDPRWSSLNNGELRLKRNGLTHYGYFPKDTDQCANLLLKTAYPSLCCIYERYFNYKLMWQQFGKSTETFSALCKNDMELVGMVPYWGDWLWFALEQYQREQVTRQIQAQWYFEPLSATLRNAFQHSWMSDAQRDALRSQESHGGLLDSQQKHMYKIANLLGECHAVFECPVCNGYESFVVEFDEDAMESGDIQPARCLCAACHFFLAEEAGFMVVPLLGDELIDKWQVLRDSYHF